MFNFIYWQLGQLERRCPVNTSLLFLQSVSGVMAGFTTTLITNPMDTIRARLQVQPILIELKQVNGFDFWMLVLWLL